MSLPIDHFRAAFAALEQERGGDAVHDLRKAGMARFAELGFPTRKHEEWAYTNVTPIAKGAFPLGRPTTNGVAAPDVAALGIGAGLVFVDGHYRADLSATPVGVDVSNLAGRFDDGLVRKHLGQYAEKDKQPFTALNTAFIEDGVFVHVPKNTKIEEPVHVLFIGTDKAAHPRNLIVVEEGAEATVVETFVSFGETAHFTNAVTETVLGANARVSHYRLQLENEQALHVSGHRVHQERDSNFTSQVVTLGGKLTRNNLTGALDGEGCLCTMNGLFLTRGDQHVDNHTWIEHRKPHCESHELYKGILDGRSSGVFSGYIHVFEDAQKTDAFQASQALLLSEDAVIDSKPQLEIYADDVKCSHGSTVGQLDDDALFYLRARGISKIEARNLLIRAFVHELSDRMTIAPVRERVDVLMEERLPA